MGPGGGYAATPAQYYDNGPVGGEVYGGEVYEGEFYDDGGFATGGFSGLTNGLGGILSIIGPVNSGGIAAPRWFDFRVELMTMNRDKSDDGIGLQSLGNAGLGDPFIVLSTNDADMDSTTGVRFTSNFMLGSSGHIEFAYMGGFNWSGETTVLDPDDSLFSVFSDFGNVPPPSSILVPFDADYDLNLVTRGGFNDTDSADEAFVEQSGEMYSFELGYRNRWQGGNPRFQGSWLVGARFMRVSEQFIYGTRVDYPNPSFFVPIVPDPGPEPILPPITGGMDYFVGTSNNMTGMQVGGDLWTTLIPGIRIGLDGKVGVYGNRATQVTSIRLASDPTVIHESANKDRATVHLEFGVLGEYRFRENITFTGGFYGMWFDGMALADENFNPGVPFLQGDRVVGIDKDGELFLSGFTGGFEYLW